jgi:tRNA1Val (adenine37-N6)-methyltransferase
MALDKAQTVDSILGGALTIVQPASGYRFAVDSILLARFVRPRQRDRILELGAGCGVVSIVLAALHHPSEIAAVEVQPQLAGLIAHNALLNDVASVTPICADIRRPIPGLRLATFGYVVLNPPYRAASRGRESPNPGRRAARGGDGAMLADFIQAAARYVSHGGRIAMVFTASRTVELISLLKQRAIEPKRIRFVHSKPQEPATMVLLEGRKAGGLETAVEPPLFIYGPSGDYTDEAQAMLTRAE